MKMRERRTKFWLLEKSGYITRSHNRKVKPLPWTYWEGKGSNAVLKQKPRRSS